MLLLTDKKYKYYLFIIWVLIFIRIIYYINEYYRKCLQCYNKSKKEKQCNICKNTLIFKGLKILSDEETLDEIIRKNKSISRFGDGEFKIIFGYGIGFQNPNTLLYL